MYVIRGVLPFQARLADNSSQYSTFRQIMGNRNKRETRRLHCKLSKVVAGDDEARTILLGSFTENIGLSKNYVNVYNGRR
jgi:hypothetical protein